MTEETSLKSMKKALEECYCFLQYIKCLHCLLMRSFLQVLNLSGLFLNHSHFASLSVFDNPVGL